MRYTDEQELFLSATSKNLLLDAPAGSGKTETVAERVRRSAVAGRKTQLTCFTHVARQTLQNRLDAAGLNLTVRTVVSLAYEAVVDEYGAFSVGDGGDIAREVCARTPVKPGHLLQLEALTVNGAPLPDSLPSVTGEVWEKYQETKEARGYMTFFDVILAATALTSFAWDELVVDEAQDLTPTQLKMLDSFGAESMVLVGDPSQAIYGFSGVDVDLFPSLELRGWETYHLTESFRVPSGILPVVNIGREIPLRSARSGGLVTASPMAYADVASHLGPLLQAGDVVIGATARQLARIVSYMALFHPSVPVSTSWAEGTHVEGTVYLTTAHSSKGGEWDRVFLLDVGAGGLWSPMGSSSADRRKLFYVAASRALSELHLIQTGASLPWGLVV